MAARADLKTVVSADTSQFTSSMRRAGATAQTTMANIGRGVGSAALSIGKLGISAVGMGAALAKAAAAAAVFKGVRMAADLEQIAISFEVMTQSAERGQKLLQEIRTMGAETPFEFQDLAEAGKVLLNFGIAADDVVPTLKMLGDISGGNSQKLGQLSLVFGQIASTGRLMGQDLLQLINSGFNPLQVISQKTGESMAALKKRMEDGAISFEEVSGAFQSATSEGGMFFGMMERQSKTFNGLLSTLSDNVNVLLTNLGQPILEGLIPYLEKAIELSQTMKIDSAAVSEHFQKAAENALMIGNWAYKGFQIVQRIGELIGTTFGTLLSADFWETFFNMGAAQLGESLSAMLTEIYKRTGNPKVWGIADVFADAAKTLRDESEPMADMYKDSFKDIFTRPLQSLEDGLKSIITETEKATQNLWDIPGLSTTYTPEGPMGPPSSLAPRVTQVDGTKYGPSKDLAGAPSIFGPSKDLMSLDANMARRYEMKSAEQASAGFGGLAELSRMKSQMFLSRAGIANIGTTTALQMGSENGLGRGQGRWSGVANETSGGLGEKRRLRTSKDDKANKKKETLEEKQTSFLESIDSNIKQSLTVN